MLNETEKLEFKENNSDGIYKTVIAFANTNGGTIYIGIDKTGEIAPLSNTDDIYTRITNGIRDAIAPDVTVFVKYTLEDSRIVRVEVGEGSGKPYYLKSKGLKPSGVYVRHGASSAPASPEQIRQMIKNADGDMFEDLRSLEQFLTFRHTSDTFDRNVMDFNSDKFYALGIRSLSQNQFTNLGLLLSDQCTHTVKVAVFADNNNTIFRDRKEFTGSVFKQTEEAFLYLQLCNQNRSVIEGLARTDYWDYPEYAIREALINAIVHRDYSFSGSIIINVNDNCMEFISIGGLLPGLATADIHNGISQLRNRKLAEVFHRLRFIESYGTGIRRIFALYEKCTEKPMISITPNSFRIVLPNMNTVVNDQLVKVAQSAKTTPQMQALLDYLLEHEEISDDEIQKTLGVKRTRTYSLVRRMTEEGLIVSDGRGKTRKHRIANSHR